MTEPDRPIFGSPEAVLRCWCRGMGGKLGLRSVDLESAGRASAPGARADRCAGRALALAAAAAIIDRARREGGLTDKQLAAAIALLVLDEDWHEAAEAAGLEDDSVTADAVKARVYRARRSALAAIEEAMER